MLTGEFTAGTTFRARRERVAAEDAGADQQTPMAMDGVNAQEKARTEAARRASGSDWGARMRDFLTDGSVSALCDELGRLMGVPIWLRDQSGEDGAVEAIIPVWSDQGKSGGAGEGRGEGHPWSFVDEGVARRRAFEQVGVADDGTYETIPVPLRISTGVLGAIVMCLPRDAMSAAAARGPEAYRLQSIRRSVLLLASSVCDVCEAQVALKKRVRELDALYRLSALLTAAGTPEQLLDAALELAIQVLRVDAGSIAVFEEGGAEAGPGPVPVVRAARGLSEDWVTDQRPLSGGGVLRQRALAGEIIAVEDLSRDPSIEDHARVQEEGLKSMLSTGLIDRDTPVGVIRLFTRSPRVFTEQEGELLRAIGEHLASGITTARLRSMRAEDERIQRQVRLAADVQRRMLPRNLPQVSPFDVAAHYAPSFELGGDFYDFIVLGGHLGILIGDVVGKGVAAALLMSAVRAAIRAHAQDLYHIDEVLSRTNKALSDDTLDNEFATVWFGVADPTSLRLTYCGAGHDWPLLVRLPAAHEHRAVEDRDVQRLTADGMALGIDPNQRYPQGMFQLQRGDVLVTFTDGLHDALNFEGKRFGGTRLRRALVELLAAEPRASAARIVEHVIAKVRQHTGLNRRVDDITVVVMRVG
jgi:serine phosphatase RsbU (regulator of sigma subunit)